MDISSLGKKIDDINVVISYKIIELFSAGLYSSPNKAFEELICNSYDAFAKNVSVHCPLDFAAEDAYIWICDDGEGLNSEELKNLWKIGDSNKRLDSGRDSRRLQIGQFGIGKLSTYILARKLTYISKKNGKYLLATMDYDRITTDVGNDGIKIEEKEINEDEAKRIAEYYIKDEIGFPLFGDKSSETWTLSLLTSLKPKATEIKLGRLKWILRTALPLNPEFQLVLNNEKIESSKVDMPILKEWIVGQDDETADNLSFANSRKDVSSENYYVDFDALKNVNGKFSLYADSLVEGKSDSLGRSHGIFLTIRGRLINLDDPLLGMDAFSHGAFNRVRIEINADELDNNLTSTREAVKESIPYIQLKEYIKKKFNNEVRKYYFEYTSALSDADGIAARMSRTSYTTSKKPIFDLISKFYNAEIQNPYLIEKPKAEDKEELLEIYSNIIKSDEQIIKEREIVGTMMPSAPMCKFDLKTQKLRINMFHPFVANYMHEFRNLIPLEGLVVTEMLTEAHMYQLGIDEEIAREIMERRNNTFCEWASYDKEGIPSVAIMLQDAIADPTGLEKSVTAALSALGFSANTIGGPGKPDGFAEAVLGYSSNGNPLNYSVTYDAKSTSKKRIAASTAHLSGLKRHQSDYNAKYCMEVAVDFEGADSEDSAVSKESIAQKVTMITVKNLLRLLLLAVPKQIGLNKLEELFSNCYSPIQVTKWIDNIEQTNPDPVPYNEIIDIIYEIQSKDTEMVTISVLRSKVNELTQKSYSTSQIVELVKALATLVPGSISLPSERYVSLQCSPEVIKARITSTIHSSLLPTEFTHMYEKIINF